MNVDTYGELRQIQSDIAMVALSLSAKSEREDDQELEAHYRKLLELHKRLDEAQGRGRNKRPRQPFTY
jgi:hypothetical protein